LTHGLFDGGIFDPAIFDTHIRMLNRVCIDLSNQHFGEYTFEAGTVAPGVDNVDVILRRVFIEMEKKQI
jgi:hypothetical protein